MDDFLIMYSSIINNIDQIRRKIQNASEIARTCLGFFERVHNSLVGKCQAFVEMEEEYVKKYSVTRKRRNDNDNPLFNRNKRLFIILKILIF